MGVLKLIWGGFGPTMRSYADREGIFLFAIPRTCSLVFSRFWHSYILYPKAYPTAMSLKLDADGGASDQGQETIEIPALRGRREGPTKIRFIRKMICV